MNKALEIKRRHERLKKLQSRELAMLTEDEKAEVEELLGLRVDFAPSRLPFPRNPAGHFGIPKEGR
jgi:hypothetical protein